MEWLDGKGERKKDVILVAIWKWPGLRMIEHPEGDCSRGWGQKRKKHQKQSQI